VAANAACVLFGRQVSSLNYDYQANLYFDELPTIENGGAVLNVVDVADGDKVVDANGDIVELASGMSIKNGDGEIVDYTGGGAQMQQMVLTWTLSDGIKWQDGEPLTRDDTGLERDRPVGQVEGACRSTEALAVVAVPPDRVVGGDVPAHLHAQPRGRRSGS